jgi:hypothetical protein
MTDRRAVKAPGVQRSPRVVVVTGDPVDGAFRLAMIVAAAVTGGCISFWLAAEWMNLDDRELTGDRFPYLVG